MKNAFASHVLVPRKKDSTNLPRIPRSSGGKTQENTERKAQWLVEKFQSPEFLPLFRKVAWRLEFGTIDRLVGIAFELGNNKRAYFISLVKKEKSYYE